MRPALWLILLGTLACGGAPTIDPALSALFRKDAAKAVEEENPQKWYDPLVIMRRGEEFHRKGDYAAAVLEYQRFLEIQPEHEWAPYAQYQLGMSYLRQASTIDRDIQPLRDALHTFERFADRFPDSPYLPQARAHVAEIRERLAARELYVGRFYYKKEAYPAARERFEDLLREYPDTPPAGWGKLYLGLTRFKMGDREEGRKLVQEVAAEAGESALQRRARRALAELGG